MRSIQTKIVFVFVALILVAMQFVGAYLLRSLEAYYLEEEKRQRATEAQLLARDLVPVLEPSTTAPGPESSSLPTPAEADAAVQQLLEEMSGGRRNRIMVLDPSGRIIAANDPTRIGNRLLQEAQVLEVMETGQVGTYLRLDPETGRSVVDAAAPIIAVAERRVLGVTLVEGDLTVIQQTLVAIRRILFQATLVALVLGALLAVVTARTITGPIKLLTGRAALMAAGDFDQRIEVRSRDELGRLAAMFNHLAGRLRETLHQIQEEKRKAEAILTHMADGVVAFDHQQRVALVNPAARRLLGLEADAFAVDEEPELQAALTAALNGDAAATSEPLVVRRAGRTLRTYLARIGEPDQPAAGAVWVLHDVTELERLEELRRQFVANVSHELRTPLTAIKSYVETLLAEQAVTLEVQQRFLRVIDAETERMVRLVRDLLDLSQLEFERVSYEREYCLASELVGQVLGKLQGQISDKRLRVEQRISFVDQPPGAREPLLYVDPDRIQQVLLNIVSNAIEFTPPGGSIFVNITAYPDAVGVEVQDTGVGIPAEDLPHIFDRFYRVDKARTRQLGGTGLGLSIARQIIEGHGGRIGVRSQQGEGTGFWFVIPLEPSGEPS